MGAFRDRRQQDLRLRGYSPNTIRPYPRPATARSKPRGQEPVYDRLRSPRPQRE